MAQVPFDFVQNELSHHGIVHNSKGFFYVDVDDAYIHRLIPFIEEDGTVIHFTPKKCKIVYPMRNGIDAAYFIVVETPELDQIRENMDCQNGNVNYLFLKEGAWREPNKLRLNRESGN